NGWYWFALAGVIGVPFLNLIERGNLIILAVFALMIYAMTYDHPSAVWREVGLICLAFSFSLKLYPLLFAWVLIGDKRYRAFVRCAIYSVLLLVLPSFAFGGPSCLLVIVKNIFSFSSGPSGVLGAVSTYLRLPGAFLTILVYGWFLLCAANFLVSVFVHREKWKIWICGCMMFLSFPSLTSTYGWLLFLIPLLMMFNVNVSGKRTLFYTIALTVPFLLLPVPLPVTQITLNAIAVYVALLGLTGYSVYDTVCACRQRFCRKSSIQKAGA
ncbi:MAG: hypothetical protein IJY42_05890, partial [Clostridia bacterium]|nr:hypothetical protein [Clostridia bacterium]